MEHAANPNRATVIVNARARGVARRFDAGAVLARFEHHGIDARVVYPPTITAARREAAAAVERGDDMLAVAGGDGSLRVVLGALAGSETALVALPAGTANVWAKEIGLPLDVPAAIDAHVAGRRIRIDLGWLDDEPFLLMASAGWDAEIVHGVGGGGRLKRMLGPGAYAVEGAGHLRALFGRPLRWTTDGEPHEATVTMLLVSNARLYGGVVRLASHADLRDGRLDVLAFEPHNPLDLARILARVPFERVPGDPAVLTSTAAEIRIETSGIPVQLDGDAAGFTPSTIRVDPLALLVSVPALPIPSVGPE